MTTREAIPAGIATSVWIECSRCGHWWLVPRRKASQPWHYIGPCCRG